jgi:predicted dehydrogenase
MKIGVIGAASIFRNRWLKILDNYPKVRLVGVARRSIDEQEDHFIQRQGYFSFRPEEVDWVYIPLPNNYHYDVAKFYLSLGVNVLIEKPSAVTQKETKELVSIGNRNNAIILEAFQWRYHKRTKWMIEKVGELNPYLIDFVFTIPHLDDENIRYQRNLNGGAGYDLGAYACSVLSTIFPNELFELVYFESWCGARVVDTGGTGIFRSEQRRMNFYYGFGNAYESRLTLHSNKGRLDLNQPFTAPSRLPVDVLWEYNTKVSTKSFVDCHFRALLNFMLDQPDSSVVNQQTLLQAKYLEKLTSKI